MNPSARYGGACRVMLALLSAQGFSAVECLIVFDLALRLARSESPPDQVKEAEQCATAMFAALPKPE